MNVLPIQPNQPSLPAVPDTRTPVTPAVIGDRAVEQALLGAFMQAGLKDKSNDLYLTVQSLTPKSFSDRAHKLIYRAMQIIVEDGGVIDMTTVSNCLKSQQEKLKPDDRVSDKYLRELCAMRGTNVKQYEVIIRKAEQRRDLFDVLVQASRIPTNGQKSFEETFSEVSALITPILIKGVAMSQAGGLTVAEGVRLLNEAFDLGEAEGLGLDTGFKSFNEVLKGGFKKKRLYLFGAHSGVGKSLLLLNFAVAMMKLGYRGLFLTVELSEQEMFQRWVSLESKIEWDRIERHQISKEEFGRFKEAVRRVTSSREAQRFVVQYMKRPTMTEVGGKIAEMYHNHGLDFVIVDYAGWKRFTPANPRLDPSLQMADIIDGLKGFSEAYNIPVIAAVQLNREAAKRGGPPMLHDIEQSIAAEQTADYIGLLQDDTNYVGMGGVTRLNVYGVKHRYGRNGVIIPLEAVKDIFSVSDWKQGS